MNEIKYTYAMELPHVFTVLYASMFGSQGADDVHASIIVCQFSPVADLEDNKFKRLISRSLVVYSID